MVVLPKAPDAGLLRHGLPQRLTVPQCLHVASFFFSVQVCVLHRIVLCTGVPFCNYSKVSLVQLLMSIWTLPGVWSVCLSVCLFFWYSCLDDLIDIQSISEGWNAQLGGHIWDHL